MINASGCSESLVAAIELRDEAAVRRMLADPTVQYADTVWVPMPLTSKSPFHVISRARKKVFVTIVWKLLNFNMLILLS